MDQLKEIFTFKKKNHKGVYMNFDSYAPLA